MRPKGRGVFRGDGEVAMDDGESTEDDGDLVMDDGEVTEGNGAPAADRIAGKAPAPPFAELEKSDDDPMVYAIPRVIIMRLTIICLLGKY